MAYVSYECWRGVLCTPFSHSGRALGRDSLSLVHTPHTVLS